MVECNTCVHHSGVEARIREIERRLDIIEKLTLRVGVLETGLGFREGSRHWSDYIITVLLAFGVFLISHYILKF